MKNILYIGDISGFFARGILEGVLSTRSSKDFNWHVWFMPNILSEKEFNKIFRKRQVDGIIARGLPENIVTAIQKLDIPSVFIRSTEETSTDHLNGPHVDDAQIAQLAGQEFKFLNLDHWGFLNWQGVSWSEARNEEFKKYAQLNNVGFSSFSIDKSYKAHLTGIEKIGQWIAELPKPCGILACNDEAGLDIIHACEVLGIIVPDEVVVIGIDNDRLLCESTEPALSSIELNAQSIGKNSAVQLAQELGLIDKEASATPAPIKVFIRESSHKIDRTKLIYQKAQHFIEKEVLNNIKVTEVAKACGISRRGLERIFQEHNEPGPAHLIREVRLKKIIEQLKDRLLTLDRIATQSGFSDAAGLSNFIKRMTGESPSHFRKQQ